MQNVAIKVAIVVEGGCVQRVLAADPARLEVIVLDYDGQDDNANRTPVPGDDHTARRADVWPATLEPLPRALDVMFGLSARRRSLALPLQAAP